MNPAAGKVLLWLRPPRDPKLTITNRAAITLWILYGLVLFLAGARSLRAADRGRSDQSVPFHSRRLGVPAGLPVISTASGLKFADFKVGYHEKKLPGIPAYKRANSPILLPNDYQPVRDAVERIIAVIDSEDDERSALLAERERIDARIAELQQS